MLIHDTIELPCCLLKPNLKHGCQAPLKFRRCSTVQVPQTQETLKGLTWSSEAAKQRAMRKRPEFLSRRLETHFALETLKLWKPSWEICVVLEDYDDAFVYRCL